MTKNTPPPPPCCLGLGVPTPPPRGQISAGTFEVGLEKGLHVASAEHSATLTTLSWACLFRKGPRPAGAQP